MVIVILVLEVDREKYWASTSTSVSSKKGKGAVEVGIVFATMHVVIGKLHEKSLLDSDSAIAGKLREIVHSGEQYDV